MKNHLKRMASPKQWPINRKKRTFIVRPNAGAHPLERGMALGVIIRDFLHLASTIGEVRKILNNQTVLVDGKRKKDHRLIVGLFDVISFPDIKKYYRVTFDIKGRISVFEISQKESNLKPCKVVGKSIIKKGKLQYNLFDGKNILSNEKAKIGDSLLLELPSLAVKKVLPLQKEATIFLEKGKQSGDSGTLKGVEGKVAIYESNGSKVETLKEYLFVVGEKKSEIVVSNNSSKSE